MCNGEVKIFQDNLNRFLSLAKRLKLEGLLGTSDDEQINTNDESNINMNEEKYNAQEIYEVIYR